MRKITSYKDVRRTLTIQAKNKLAVAKAKTKRNMRNITYRHRQPNMTAREQIKVIDVIEQVSRRKWTWAGHNNRIEIRGGHHVSPPGKITKRSDLEEDW